jgi:hypothetical protein
VIVEEDDEVEGSIGIIVVKVLTDVLIVWIEVEDRVVEELVVGVMVADGTRADETELIEDTGVETDDIELDNNEVVGLELEDVDTVLVDDELLVLLARMLDVELESTTEETLDVWLEAVARELAAISLPYDSKLSRYQAMSGHPSCKRSTDQDVDLSVK